MAGEYKSACGCTIHVAQWTARRKVVTTKSCPLHKAAPDLLAACKAALRFSQCSHDSDMDVESLLVRAIAKAEVKEN